MGLKTPKTMMQSEKQKSFVGEYVGKHYPSVPWSMKGNVGMCGECVWSCTVGICIFHSSVLLHHVRMVSSISSLESGRLAIFFKDRR